MTAKETNDEIETDETRLTAEPGEQTIKITRVFDAPREHVWEAWTDPEELAEWWGPSGYTLPHCEIDLEPGGAWHFCMRSPEGEEYWCKSVYREVVEPERLVYVDSFSDEDGNVVDPTEFGMSEGFPAEPLVTVLFEEDEGQTEVTVRYEVATATDAERADMRTGFDESLDRLADVLDGAPDDSDDRAEVVE